MTKEQYSLFKEDLKKAIEVVKLNNKHRKAYWNDGFETHEAQVAAIKEDGAKISEIEETMTNKIDGGLRYTHWAYYCAKHQLTDEQIIAYAKEENDKLIIPEWNLDYMVKRIKSQLLSYEKIVCDNEPVA